MTTSFPISEAYVDGQVLTAANVNQIAGAVNDLSAVQLNAQTGTSYTLVLADRSKTVTLSNAASITLNVPTDATAMPWFDTCSASSRSSAARPTRPTPRCWHLAFERA